MKFLVVAASFLLAILSANAEDGSPELYVFQNGLGFGSMEEEAKELSRLGYAGVSQVKGTAEELGQTVAVYGEKGLRVRSIYLDAGDIPVDPKKLEAVAVSGAMVELTVKMMEPGTVESVRGFCDEVEKLGMKVAVYPHHGFAVGTMPQAMDFLAKVNHPRLGVMFNLCHFLRGENPANLEKVIQEAGDRLFAVSVSGADEGGKDWGALIKPLDQGDFPVNQLLEMLEKANFRGPISLQCYGVPGDKKKNLERSIAAWKRLSE